MLHKLQITTLLDSKREDRNSALGGSNTRRTVSAFLLLHECKAAILLSLQNT